MENIFKKHKLQIISYTFFWTVMFFVAVPFACIVSCEGLDIFRNFIVILTSPSKLVTDYFNLGSLGAAFLNAGICGLSCNIIMIVTKAKPNATMLAGYFLVVAHCFYGLNILNMWPPFFGILVFCLIFRKNFGELLPIAMFSTSLGPFISDLLFRYTLGDKFDPNNPKITVLGIVLAIVFGLASGFIIPALLSGTAKMHRGHNLFKAGLAIGLFGMFAHALLYNTMGIETPDTIIRDNALYQDAGESYILFIDCFFLFMFLVTFFVGFMANGKSVKGYKKLWDCDGLDDDFIELFDMPLTLINIGIYGFSILLYINLVLLLTPGVGYSGPTLGVTIAAITFSASGQTPRTVWPIALGYALLSALTGGICTLAGLPIAWTLSTQSYINGFAFATGLCPFSGRYGWKIGVVAGMLDAILCTSTSAMHGGFVLYNGGLTAGLTALLLLPILDYYFEIKVKK